MRNNSDGNVPQLRTRRLVPSRTAQPLSEPRRRTSSSSSRPSIPSAPISHRVLREPVVPRRVVSRPTVTDDRQSRRAKMTALYEGKSGGRDVSTAPPRTQEVPPPPTSSMLSMNVVRESLLGYDPSFAALPWEQPSWNPPPRSILHDRPAPSVAPPPLTPLSHHQRQTLNELAEVDKRLEMLCGGSPVATRSAPVDRQLVGHQSHPSYRQPMGTTTPRPWGVQGHLAKQVFDTAGPMYIPPSPVGRALTPHHHPINQPEPTLGQPVPPLDLALLQDV